MAYAGVGFAVCFAYGHSASETKRHCPPLDGMHIMCVLLYLIKVCVGLYSPCPSASTVWSDSGKGVHEEPSVGQT